MIRIGIILTSIERDRSLFESIGSMLKVIQPNWMIIIGYQAKDQIIEFNHPQIYCYQLPYNCGLCLDSKTEILTKTGWKSYKNITKEDQALSINSKTNIADYYPISDIYINKNYKGIMYKYEGKNSDFCVTPNHKMLIKRYGVYKENDWKLQEIQSIKDKSYLIKQHFIWKGIDQKEFILPSLSKIAKRKNHRNSRKIDIKLWLEFLGWYISEGCIVTTSKNCHYKISIAQVKDQYKLEIQELLNKLQLNWNYSSNAFNIHDKQIWDWIKNNCYNGKKIKIKSVYNCYNKIVPNFIKNLNPELINIFLTSYCKGDGHIEKSGRTSYITSSKLLSNDLQELVLKTGKYASVLKIKPKTAIIKGRKIFPQKFHYIVKIHLKNNFSIIFNRPYKNSVIIKKNKYNGIVWCITVNPHNLIYIRRNGKCCWTGNSVARNDLIEKSHALGCKYTLLSADSILFDESMKDIDHLFPALDRYDLLGLSLSNRVQWEGKLNLIPDKYFEIDFIEKNLKDGIWQIGDKVFNIWNCEIVRNFWIARTETLLKVRYDNDLVMCEHEDMFIRYKEAGYKVGCTNLCGGTYNKSENTPEYDRIRSENFRLGMQRLLKKYNLKSWVKYINFERIKA